GREAGPGVELAAGQLLGPPAAPGNAPEPLAVLAVLDGAPRVDDPLAVGRDRELLHLHLPQEVARPKKRLLRHAANLSRAARTGKPQRRPPVVVGSRAIRTPLTRSREAGKESHDVACPHRREDPPGRGRPRPDALPDRPRD